MLPRVSASVSFLVICASPGGGACFGRMSIFYIKTARETYVPVCVPFDDVGIHWCHIMWRILLCKQRNTSATAASNGGQSTLATASHEVCKRCMPLASCVSPLSTTTSSLPSTDSQSCRLERSKVRDVELLHGWWGWCHWLIRCIACL
jgi:hypothetical protein